MRSWLASWRFLLSRRWVLFFLAIILLGYGTWWLGEWQFGRLEDRRERNEVVAANEDRAPVPVSEVLAPGRPVAKDDEWRLVSARGVYDVEDTVVVRYRTRSGMPGVEVVVPLVTADGTAVVVDRGWFATDDPQIGPDELPAPPAGEVAITGWVRADGEGDSTKVVGRSTRAISSERIGEAIGTPVLTGFVALKAEDPEPEDALEPVELPELGEGPHFFYGLQWWFFGVLGIGGFAYLAWDERRNGRRGERRRKERAPGPFSRRREDPAQSPRDIPPSTGTITPDTNEAAGDSTNAATRPNSSG
ncbi:SURF1 family cytochrome oxidase biogenesis protein [Nocardioides sp. J54]|uniref:SURF1 family cytochrome oxidase biogenesis protein n=1 Tax=Nocardioides sp. J54 TaxID=935866 RepID=UPI0006857A43|nr:SURF1 family protein [Nocardioides sp. J54]